MTGVVWLLGLSILALALWCFGAFVLRLRHSGRLALTLLVPGLVAGAACWSVYLGGPTGDPGWDALFVLVSTFAGAFAGVGMLPIWYLVEENLGWRAR